MSREGDPSVNYMHYYGGVSKSLIQALVAAAISSLLGVFVYKIARDQKINFRYTVGWLTLCIFGISSGIVGSFINPMSRTLGITPAALIGILGMLLFLVISIQISVSISGLQIQNRKMSEIIAIREGEYTKNESTTTQNNMLTHLNTLIIVPAFNEELNVSAVVSEVQAMGYEVLVVDDGSTDDTIEVAKKCGAKVLSLPFNLGVGGALRAGFKVASLRGYEAIVQVDADGQHQTSEIIKLLNEANASSSHLVLGSRFRSLTNELEIGMARRFIIRLLARSASKATRVRITDPTSGFRLIREPLLSEFSLNFPVNYLGDTYEALVSAGRAGYKVREVPAAMKNRVHGVSTASNAQAIKFIIKSLLVAMVRLHVRIEKYPGDNIRNAQ